MAHEIFLGFSRYRIGSIELTETMWVVEFQQPELVFYLLIFNGRNFNPSLISNSILNYMIDLSWLTLVDYYFCFATTGSTIVDSVILEAFLINHIILCCTVVPAL